jgi:flagellar assembly protein FliH
VINIEVTPIAEASYPQEAPPDARMSDSPEEKARKMVKKAGSEAEVILQKARKEAEEIIAAARVQSEAESEQLRKAAHNEGYTKGFAQAEAEGNKIKEQAKQVLADAHKERKRMEASLEPDMVALVQDIAAKLIGDVTRLYPETILYLIRQGLSDTSLTGEVSIHVSPKDYVTAAEYSKQLTELADSSVKIEVVRDPSLNEMDCVIETPFGNIDCSLTQQFESLRDQLTYILHTGKNND